MNNKNRTPIHTQAERMEDIRGVVKKLGINTQVVPLESDLSDALVQVNSFKPDVYCKGSDQNTIFEASLRQLYPYMEISTIDRRPEISQSTTQLYFSNSQL